MRAAGADTAVHGVPDESCVAHIKIKSRETQHNFVSIIYSSCSLGFTAVITFSLIIKDAFPFCDEEQVFLIPLKQDESNRRRLFIIIIY